MRRTYRAALSRFRKAAGPGAAALAAALVCAGAQAQQGDAATREARALFDKICEKGVDRGLLMERFVELGERALPFLREELRKHVAGRRQVENAFEQGVIGIGGGAGGRFGGRRGKVLLPPTRGEDPLASYAATAHFELANLSWLRFAPHRDSFLAYAQGRERMLFEAIRRLGRTAEPALPELLAYVDACGQDFPDVGVLRALAAVGDSVRVPLTKRRDSRTANYALAYCGPEGVRTLLERVREDRDVPELAGHHCRALANVPKWPAGVPASALVEAAFSDRAAVREPARFALWQHAQGLRSEINRLRAPENVGTKKERFAYTVLGMRLEIGDALGILRRVVVRRRDRTKARRMIAYACIGRRADEVVAGGHAASVFELLEDRYGKLEGSILEAVGVLRAFAALREAQVQRGEEAPMPAAFRSACGHRAWQVRLAAVRCVRAGDEEHAAELLAATRDKRIEVRLEAWDAFARLRIASQAEVADALRASIEEVVLDFNVEDYSNNGGLIALACVRAIPALEARHGSRLRSFLRREFAKAQQKSWWIDALFDAAAGLGEHVPSLAEAILARKEWRTSRLRAVAAILGDDPRVLELLGSEELRLQDVRDLAAFCARAGTPRQVEAIAERCRRATPKDYRHFARAWTEHAAFARVHMTMAERLPADARSLPLACLRELGQKAAAVRARLANLLEHEKCRERRAALQGVLAATR